MKLTYYIFLMATLFCLACNGQAKKPDIGNSQGSGLKISKEEVKVQLGDKYDLSVTSLAANHGKEFDPMAYDTTIVGKYKIDEILNNKTLLREIETLPFDQNLVDQYDFKSPTKFYHAFYEL